MSVCAKCTQGFKWDGQPEGSVVSFPASTNQAYKVGSNDEVAVMLIHDLFGWDFVNIRLLADHYAREANATVYVPDFFGGESLPSDIVADQSRWAQIDIHGFIAKHSRDIREPEIFACAKKLRSEYKKVGAVGFCYGGWAVMRLGAEGNNFVDCIVPGHPSLLTKDDIDGIAVPTQILAPEIDEAYTPELKEHTWKVLQKKGVSFDYQHFAGVEHSCFIRGDPNSPGERAAMARGKNAAVSWLQQWLHGE